MSLSPIRNSCANAGSGVVRISQRTPAERLTMKALSSVASVTIHCAIGAAVLLGSARTGRSTPNHPTQVSIVFPTPAATHTSSIPAPSGLTAPGDLGRISIPDFKFQTGAPGPSTFPVISTTPSTASGSAPANGWVMLGSENGPQVLTGPLPRYPELLRQAGIEGRVLLEAIVDTTGQVLRDSIVVVAATHPEFVAAARQAALATLFRPAFVAGRAVRVRVRIPYEFTIRNGMRPAR